MATPHEAPTAGPDIRVACLSHSPSMDTPKARDQGQTFRAGMERLRVAITAWDPTLVIYFGPDHVRALTDIVPAFTLAERAVGFGDWGIPAEDYAVATPIAAQLAQHLIDAGIDLAVAETIRLDHGFSQSMYHLFGGLGRVPSVPIVINCVREPMPTMARVAALAGAVGDYIRTCLDGRHRVLVLASGGLSHSPPILVPGFRAMSPEQQRPLIDAARTAVNPDWDAQFQALLDSGSWAELAAMDADALRGAGSGGNEVRVWIAAALTAGQPLKPIAYEAMTEWITGMGISASAALFADA